jgi:hypothetical protein
VIILQPDLVSRRRQDLVIVRLLEDRSALVGVLAI